eukprot:340944-Pyramimonas_sp.AAC.1
MAAAALHSSPRANSPVCTIGSNASRYSRGDTPKSLRPQVNCPSQPVNCPPQPVNCPTQPVSSPPQP